MAHASFGPALQAIGLASLGYGVSKSGIINNQDSEVRADIIVLLHLPSAHTFWSHAGCQAMWVLCLDPSCNSAIFYEVFGCCATLYELLPTHANLRLACRSQGTQLSWAIAAGATLTLTLAALGTMWYTLDAVQSSPVSSKAIA